MTLTNWEREELEALRTLVRLYSHRINQLEEYLYIIEKNYDIKIQSLGEQNDQDKCNTSK